jgi:hypothetical protein
MGEIIQARDGWVLKVLSIKHLVWTERIMARVLLLRITTLILIALTDWEAGSGKSILEK